ncbi:cytochrome c [Azospirillum sp. B4]|uniref:c-type cytochrome n=1 Tax=Azospirillum sp. B4 TaxID=95605 RepID=UPI0003499F96|nr:c-type cytochrome [Azospirillum sp. B4]
MSIEPLFTFRNRWFTTSVAVTAGLFLVAALAGFLWLPSLQSNRGQAAEGAGGIWGEICSAAGVFRPGPAKSVTKPDFRGTQVALTPTLLKGADAASVGRGATLALQCSMCHGARGLSEADSPNLAGQHPLVIYKQLQDFKSGARSSAVMEPLVAKLTDQDMRDLAAFYAYLPRAPWNIPTDAPPPRIVISGAPVRGIAPCGACHGTLSMKPGAAWLDGQSPVYIRAQLVAFAAGTRHNDIGQQMRNIARVMTAAEIDEAARYYAGAQQ